MTPGGAATVEARPRLAIWGLTVVAVGALAVALGTFASVDAQKSLAGFLLVLVFVAAVAGFVRVPHMAAAGTVVLFALIPSLKVFIGDWVGVLKDLVVLAAAIAGAYFFFFQRRRPDPWVLGLVGLLVALYVVNLGGGHGVAWAQGVRLFGEPLVLLLVGLVLPGRRKTFRWAVGALLGTACFVALYGLLQQAVGSWTVVSWGYDFNKQVRTVGGHLRSFGTFDDPFAYAAFLLFGLAALIFWFRRVPRVFVAGALILAGLAASYVRTAALVLAALVGLAIVRRFRLPARAVAIGAATFAGLAIVSTLAVGGAGETQTFRHKIETSHGTRVETLRVHNVVLNGRAEAWKAALGSDPRAWIFGRGVGRVGTAADRAAYTFTSRTAVALADKQAACIAGRVKNCPVDSGYLATVADVGIVGLAVLLALFGRLVALAARAARQQKDAGWLALGLLVTLLLDALARSSFTGFPTAFLALLLVGLALSAARADKPRLTGLGPYARRREPQVRRAPTPHEAGPGRGLLSALRGAARDRDARRQALAAVGARWRRQIAILAPVRKAGARAARSLRRRLTSAWRAGAERDSVWALATALATMVAASVVMQLWRADLSIPLYGRLADITPFEMVVRATIDHGWYLNNHDLAAPLGQNLWGWRGVDGDSLQLLVQKLIGFASSNSALVVNVYYLLTFPLIAAVAFLVLRRLDCSRGSALVAATLFATLPYHFAHAHVYLSNYIAVPLGAYLVLTIFNWDPLFARRAGTDGLRAWLSPRSLTTAAICFVVATTGIYYAVFTIILVAVATVLSVLTGAGRRTAVTGMAVLTLLASTLVLDDAPRLVHDALHGSEPAAAVRGDLETEHYSLKLTDLVFPFVNHRAKAFAEFSRHYQATSLQGLNESAAASLGLVGTVGFVWLILAVLTAPLGRRRLGTVRQRHAGVATLVAFGFATLGGGSSVIAYTISPSLRAWSRFSVFIAFFSLLAVAQLLDAARVRLGRRSGLLTAVMLALVLVVGLDDQTNPGFTPPYSAAAAQHRSDSAFVSQIEHRLPRGAAVFQLPIVPFPEAGKRFAMPDYDHLRMYLASRHLRWSYGTAKNSRRDWQAALNVSDVNGTLQKIALTGFDGIEVERLGYPDRAAALERTLQALTGVAPIVSRDGQLSFFDLRAYAERVRARLSPTQLAAERRSVLEPYTHR